MPKIKRKTPKWSQHKSTWENCTKCDLHECRTKTVLGKGKIPCEVLFVGEAPGVSEDVIGKPFAGPAGTLLEEQIIEAGMRSTKRFYTNLIACIPFDENGDKAKQPSKKSLKACEARISELIALTNPDILIAVGNLAEKRLASVTLPLFKIIHPAAILRLDQPHRGLAHEKNVAILTSAMDELTPF